MDTDLKLRRRVIQELEWDPAVDATHLDVGVHDGIVTLTGTASSPAARAAAEAAVKGVRGVRAVVESIVVRADEARQRTDEALATAAVAALERARVPRDRVTITVEAGIIRLEGEVESLHQQDTVVRTISRLTGVRDLKNDLRVASQPQTSELKTAVKAALARSAGLDASAIDVRALDRRVMLLGSVGSWSAFAEAERIAWDTPGVEAVENDLMIRLPLTTGA
jgi:osmotically-inducible protein OsmY